MIHVKSVLPINPLSSFYRFFKSCVNTSVPTPALDGELSYPTPCLSMPRNANESASVVRSFRLVSAVNSPTYLSEIFYTIIQTVSVYVVNFLYRHFSIHKQPNYSMVQKFTTINRGLHVCPSFASHQVANFITYIRAVTSSDLPKKFTRSSFESKHLVSSFKGQFKFFHRSGVYS